MTKQQIHIRIENDTYLILKSKNINISSLVNQLLTTYLENEQIEIPEEVELIKQLEESKKTINLHKDKVSQLTVMLAKVREDNRIREKEEEELKKDQHLLIRQMLNTEARMEYD